MKAGVLRGSAHAQACRMCHFSHRVCARARVCEVIFHTLLGQGLSLLAKPPFLSLSTAVSLRSLYFIYLQSEYSVAGLRASARVFSSPQHKLIIFIRPAVVPQTTGQISQSFHRLKYRFEKWESSGCSRRHERGSASFMGMYSISRSILMFALADK